MKPPDVEVHQRSEHRVPAHRTAVCIRPSSMNDQHCTPLYIVAGTLSFATLALLVSTILLFCRLRKYKTMLDTSLAHHRAVAYLNDDDDDADDEKGIGRSHVSRALSVGGKTGERSPVRGTSPAQQPQKTQLLSRASPSDTPHDSLLATPALAPTLPADDVIDMLAGSPRDRSHSLNVLTSPGVGYGQQSAAQLEASPPGRYGGSIRSRGATSSTPRPTPSQAEGTEQQQQQQQQQQSSAASQKPRHGRTHTYSNVPAPAAKSSAGAGAVGGGRRNTGQRGEAAPRAAVTAATATPTATATSTSSTQPNSGGTRRVSYTQVDLKPLSTKPSADQESPAAETVQPSAHKPTVYTDVVLKL